MRCSQKRRCHRPRSPRLARLRETRSPLSIAREKCPLIRLQRVEKSESPDASVQTQCKWSGRITTASIWKGCLARTLRNAVRNTSSRSTNRRFPRRSARFTVKNYVAPGCQARRYSVMDHLLSPSSFRDRCGSLRSPHPTGAFQHCSYQRLS